MAALHGICILLMVGGRVLPKTTPDINDKVATGLLSAKLRAERIYSKVWGRQGVLGVNGGHFHAILVTRELVETALQTQQAYRMSWYLPRWLLNRFYLCLLVLNCWSSVFIYSLLFKKNEARRRFACLLCDCILDLVDGIASRGLLAF
ncbi:uncharacterized protein PITG_18807 [Phytophthora infestans T30-4]|uniref:Transmembrane protein n=1 Tax=Phytophthora infestans (strain T30-4) TaxID=403677 RepID=D0NZF8_PHYIT|nr:uncharacterized protein PITG_18807 [Phytophthora infestans T30-4]EEY69512.1 conserved hypothetical protein [Phytophthora infestans T30-4]|eukprot:XP_002997279.1 conserved hypothetical protein [Phytophthora infestans T30-4]